MSPDYEALTVECRATGGRILREIILKPEAFAKLSPTCPIAQTIPPRPFSYEDEDFPKVVRHMERIVGGMTVGDLSLRGSYLVSQPRKIFQDR
jgi:hypothetical protein